MGGREGSGRLVGGEVELPRLLSLVQAVSVKVRLCVEVVVGGHLLVQPKVLHPHCLQKIRHQPVLLNFKTDPVFPLFALTPSIELNFTATIACNFGAGQKSCKKVASTYPCALRGAGERGDYWP